MTVNLPTKGELPPNYRVYKNGAIFDTDKGRIVSSKNVTTKITPERSVELLSRRLELKRSTIAAAANEAVESGDLRTRYGDTAFIADIARVMMMRATTPEDNRGVDAAKWLIQEAGLSEKQAEIQQNTADLGAITDLVAALASFAGAVAGNGFDNCNYDKQQETIDADVQDSDEDAGSGDSGGELGG